MAILEPLPDSDVPRVLLFGHRGAGKSALIGALLQAGETQGETLLGEVVHSSVDLPRIRDAVYSGRKLEPQHRELVSYSIRLRPWRVNGKPVGDPMSVVLDDCDGAAAESLLEHPEPITQRAPNTPLARAVVGADAIALLVDASSTDDELKEAFIDFDKFIKVVKRAKTEERQVGGFPVFLVLTQCDRLARPGDTMTTWEERVDQRTEAAWKAFDTFLTEAGQEQDGTPYLAFGSIDLTVIAVAVRRPPLTASPNLTKEPFHVAELFRDCFAGAKAHRRRVRSSESRLKWTVRFALTALVLLLSSLATITFFPPDASGPTLEDRVRQYVRTEPRAAIRLAGGEITRNKQALRGFALDPAFASLSPDMRMFVQSRLQEIEDYEAYRDKLANAIAPGSTRNRPDLEKVRQSLLTELALPPQYAWQETTAAELRDKWLSDAAVIEEAQRLMVASYREHDRAGTAHMVTRRFDEAWNQELNALIDRGDRPPHPLNEPIPGSPAIKQPRGEAVMYRVPYEFDEVYTARRYWEQTRDRLLHLRDLADALGVSTRPNRPEAVLVIPAEEPIDPAARWATLLRTYTRPSEGYPEWQVGNFPDPARAELAMRLKRSFDNGVRHLQKRTKVEDTIEGWKALGGTLTEPGYREWGRLLHLLARLQDPAAPDPVAELAKFLHDLDNKTFELDLRGFELSIPLDLTVGLDRVEPAGQFVASVLRNGTVRGSVSFNVGKGETRDKATVYFLAPEGNGSLQYRAGDDFQAELPVKAGNQMLKLVWKRGPSNIFRFDRLEREPRLAKPEGGSDAAPGVRLTLSAGSIPRLPTLMPMN